MKRTTVFDQPHLPALDGLRALAVTLVVLYHSGLPVGGDLGVTTFFVLSGFLITWLMMKELRATGTVSFSSFYTRRTLRIFPAYYAFMVFSIVWDRLHNRMWTGWRTAAAFGYFMNYYNAAVGHEGSIAHAWSLAVEEQFYLIWPLAFLFLARGGIDRVRRVLAVTIVAVMLWRSFLYVVVDTGSPYVYNAFDTRFDSIALGCLIAAWATSETFVRTARALATRLAPLLTIAAIFATRHFMHSTYHYTIGLTLEAVLLGLLILQLMQLTSSPMWSWLESAPLRYIGLISYPIYLWHQLAIDFSHKLVTGMPARIALGFAAVVVVASGSYYFIEKPMLALRKHKRVLSPLTPAKYES